MIWRIPNVIDIKHGFHTRLTGASAISYSGSQSHKKIMNKHVAKYGKPWDSSNGSMIMTLDLRAEKYGTLTIETENHLEFYMMR